MQGLINSRNFLTKNAIQTLNFFNLEKLDI